MMQNRTIVAWALVLFHLTVLAPVAHAGIDGMVANDSGRSGRIFLTLADGSGVETGLGASVPADGAAPVPFSISGVSDGTYSLTAYLDTAGNGVRHANDPALTVTGIVVSSGSGNAGTVTLPPPVGTILPPAPLAAPLVIPASGGVAVKLVDLPTADGFPVAESLNLSCGAAGSVNGIPGSAGSLAYLPLTDGTTVSCTVTPVIAGVPQPAYASPASIPLQSGETCTILATCATGSVVSGSVSFAGASPTPSTPLVITLTNTSGQAQLPYTAIIASPGNPTAFSLTGVAPGTYTIRAVLDHNGGSGDRILGRGDLFADEDRVGMVVVDGTGATVVPGIVLEPRNAFVRLGVAHTLNGGTDYALTVTGRDGTKRTAALTLTNGTGSQFPASGVTIGRSQAGTLRYTSPAFSARPLPGDSYPASVTYDDGTVDTLPLRVSAVLDDFPVPTAMASAAGSGDPAGAVMAWRTPSPLPVFPYTYTTGMTPDTPGSGSDPLPATSLYRLLSLGAPPAPGATFAWSVSLNDTFGNSATSTGLYTATDTGPTVTGISPQSGPAGSAVTITGTGLSQTTAVSFNGRPGTISFKNDTTVTATVPANASSGPVFVTAGGTTASSTHFTPTIAMVGTVQNQAGTGIEGVDVKLVGNQTVTATSGTNGLYLISPSSGIPAGVPFVIRVSDPNRVLSTNHDAYSAFLSSTANLLGRNYTLWSDAALTAAGFYSVRDNTGGMIGAQVVGGTGTAVAGATVSVTSWKRPDVTDPYPVRYDDGYGAPSSSATSTPDNGRFYVLDIDDGDVVTVKPTKDGWAFAPLVFQAHAGAVSQGTASGDTMPAVTISPAPGTYHTPQSVTLSTTSPATVYCTTDGRDPLFYGAPCTSAISVTADTTIRYLVRNGAGLAGGAGSAVYLISPMPATASIVSITPNPSTYGQPVTITAAVVPVGASGTVRFSNGQGWQESVEVSTISGSAAATTSALPAGNNTITAQYLGDATHGASPVSAGAALVVNKATATVTLGSLGAIYDGAPKGATAATVPAGLTLTFTYNGSPTPPAAAGSYTVVATVSDPNYQGSASGTLTIAKASTTVAVTSVAPNPSVYGQPVTVTAVVSPPGGSGKVRFANGQGWQESVDVSTISGSAATTTSVLPAGSCNITAQYLGDANYAASPVSSGVTQVVNKAAATVVLGSLSQIYNGTPRVATASTAPAGLAVTFTYDGSATAPTAAGSYAVVATVTDPNYQGSATGTLTIARAPTTALIAATAPNPSTYGQAVTITATVSPSVSSGTLRFSNGQGWQESVDLSTVSGTAATTTTTLPTGTSTITAQYLGNASYAPSPVSAGVTQVVNKAGQTIAFAALPARSYGDPSFTLNATATSGLAVSYASSNPAVATVSGATVTIVGAGTAIITASQGGDGNFEAAPPVTQSLTVNKATATVTLAGLSTTYDGSPRAVTATTVPPGLAVTFTYDGSATPPVGAGNYTVVAAVSDANYQGSATGTLTVAKAGQTLTFAPLPARTYGDAPLILSATVTSGLPVSFTSSNPAVATVSGTTVAIVGAGSAVITASQEGDDNHNAPPPVTQSLTVARAPLGVATTDAGRLYGSANPAFGATYSGFVNGDTQAVLTGAPVLTTAATTASPAGTYPITAAAGSLAAANYTFTFIGATLTVSKAPLTVRATDATRVYGTANPTFSATYSGFVNGDTQAILTGTPSLATAATAASPAGTYPIVAGPGTLAAANYTFTFSDGILTVVKADQTVAFAALPAHVYGDPSFTLAATATSGLGVTFASSNPAVATVSGATLTIVGAGTATITASQAGDGNYNPASPVARALTVTKATATVILGSLSATFDGTPKAATATTIPPGLAVVLTYDGSTTPPFKKGNYTVVGTISDQNYQGSATGTLTIARGTQRITFAPLPGKTYGDAPFQLTATSSSGLPVNYVSSNPAVATVSGSTVTIHAAGTTTITASQSGDNNYNAAQSESQTLTVTKAVLTVTANDASRTYGAANPPLGVTYSGFVNGDTQTVLTGAPALSTAATPATPAGNSTITVTAGTLGAANYSFVFASGTLTIARALLSVTPADATRTYGAADPAFTAGYTGFVNGETPAVVSGSPVFATTASLASPVGTYPITVAVGTLAAPNYDFVFGTSVLTVARANQNITFAPLPARSYGEPSFPLAATATSGLTVSYTSSNPAVATVNGATVTIVSAGTTTITASQSGDANNYPAAAVPQTLTVNRGTATVLLGGLNATYDGTAKGATVTTTPAGLPVTVTYDGGAPLPVAAGSYTVTATVSDPNYDGTATATLTIARANQTITFADLPARTYGDPPFTLVATATSGLGVSFTSSNTAVATVSGTVVTIVGAGTTTITASQGGNGNYNPAPGVPRTLTVSALPQGIKLLDNGSFSYFATLTSAYNAIAGGTDTTISLAAGTQTETVVFDRNVRLTLAGGYDQAFSAFTGVTTLRGSITFANGTVNIAGSLAVTAN